MSKMLMDRPGLVIFVGGVICLVASAALGSYLAHEAATRLNQLHLDEIVRHDSLPEIAADRFLLANVNALMWLVFGLGACLTLLGLRMLTRPKLDFSPSTPIGSIRDVFENPD
jgi:hypothetical protein